MQSTIVLVIWVALDESKQPSATKKNIVFLEGQSRDSRVLVKKVKKPTIVQLVTQQTIDRVVAGLNPGSARTYELNLRRQSDLRPLTASWSRVREPTDPPGDWRPTRSRLPSVI